MPVLAADIGATHARFGWFEEGNLTESIWLNSQAASFSHVLAELARIKPHMNPQKADCVAIALPGPVNGRKGKPSHLAYEVDLDALGLKKAILLNDFEAQAYAMLGPLKNTMQVIAPGNSSLAKNPVWAVVGPGSGLGMGFALPEKGMVFPSEGGHMALPMQGQEEAAFEAFAKKRLNAPNVPLTGDSLLCGPGLELMHEYCTGERRKAADIAGIQNFAQSRAAALFSTLLGRACRTFALCLLPQMLVITGGVVAKNSHLLHNKHFLHAFASGRHPLPNLRILLNTNQEAGLWGAARAAQNIIE